MGLRKGLIQGEQGQALVEFSFICIILLMLAGGVIDCVNIMRYNIALSGAATEIVNQITPSKARNKPEVEDICDAVIYENYSNSLGDGNTNYSCTVNNEAVVDNQRIYKYHDYNDGDYIDWITRREYIPITVTIERNQVMLTPFGQLVFGDSGGNGRRHMEAKKHVRVYLDIVELE